MTANNLSFLHLLSFQTAKSTTLNKRIPLQTFRRSTNQSFQTIKRLHQQPHNIILLNRINILRKVIMHSYSTLSFVRHKGISKIKNKKQKLLDNKIKFFLSFKNIQLVFFKQQVQQLIRIQERQRFQLRFIIKKYQSILLRKKQINLNKNKNKIKINQINKQIKINQKNYQQNNNQKNQINKITNKDKNKKLIKNKSQTKMIKNKQKLEKRKKERERERAH
ncbi:hypothetical protein ABPG73_015256 [Tetrahymena malaccensis]